MNPETDLISDSIDIIAKFSTLMQKIVNSPRNNTKIIILKMDDEEIVIAEKNTGPQI